MSQERIRKRTTEQSHVGDEYADVQSDEDSSARDMVDDLDDLLDEIDEVLEENADTFVKNYVQKRWGMINRSKPG